ncbi:MAG: acyl-CoA desaturase [Planctomycetes bacterium]|nr:acyl-CoA desaturase [Planctomycetota bacterium]
MNEAPQPAQPSFFKSLYLWFVPSNDQELPDENDERIDWYRAIPFIGMHLGCFLVFFAGWSWLAVSVAAFLYALRVFTLTGFYHRYFSHRSFKTWRIVQFIFAVIGCSSVQRGPLWWAAHHRHHHVHSDDPEDLHSPREKGILYSHFGWFLSPKALKTNYKIIPDFAKYPELRFLDRWDLLVPIALALALFGFGELVAYGAPEWGADGFQLLVWGFFLSTIAVYHVTYLVNSATHLIGTRRYETKDDSRNSLIIALLTFGEGWHNNHHYYPNSTRQGFYWWEIDITYYILLFMQLLGLVWNIKEVPDRIREPKPKVAADPAPVPPEAKPAAVLPT